MRRSKPRVDAGILWAALVVSIVLAIAWWVPGSPRSDFDSFSVRPRGKRAYFDILTNLGYTVERATDILPRTLDTAGTLFILGPARYPNRRELDAIAGWVREGGTLIFASSHEHPEIDLGALGVEVRSTELVGEKKSEAATRKLEKKFENERAEAEDDRLGGPPVAARSNLLSGPVPWPRGAHVEISSADAITLVEADGLPRVVAVAHGDGVAVVCASDEAFSNLVLESDEAALLLAVRIFEYTESPSSVVVDESLNATGTPRIVGALFGPELRRLTLQIVLCAVLFAWAGSRRFGPKRNADPPPRRSIIEHARALGHLYWRRRSGGVLLERYVEHVAPGPRAVDRGRRGEGPMRSLTERIESLVPPDTTSEETRPILRDVRTLIGRERASSRSVGRAIRELAQLRHRSGER